MSTYDEDLIDDIIGNELNENIRGDGEIFSDPDDDNNDEAEKKNDVAATSKQVIEPKKRSVRNPRPTLNLEILTGNRGIHTIENYFKDIKYHGKGHEKQDLDEILKRLKHWAHRMYPSYKFDDILVNIERLSKKKPLQHYMNRYRQGTLDTNEKDHDGDANIDDVERNEELDEPFDEFDALINQQIANSKLPPVTPSTTMDRRGNTSIISSVLDTPRFAKGSGKTSTPCGKDTTLNNATVISMIQQQPQQEQNDHIISQSEILTQPHQADEQNADDIPEFLKNRTDLTAEQLARIAENRRLAKERLKAKKLAMNNIQ